MPPVPDPGKQTAATTPQNPAWWTATDPNIPGWENQQLNQLFSSGKLWGIPPEILAAIDQAESSGSGGAINSAGYGGWFGLGQSSNYPGGASNAGLLHGTDVGSFDTQAELAASEFAAMLKQEGGNPYLAEAAYQTGPANPNLASYAQSGEGPNIFRQLGIPNSLLAAGTGTPVGGGVSGTAGGQTLPPEIQQLLQDALAQQQAALSPQVLQEQLKILAENYGFSQQQFGVEASQLGLEATANREQLAHLEKQFGFEQTQDVLSGRQIASNIQNIIANYGFQQQQFGVQQKQLNLAGLQATTANSASGVVNTGTQRQTVQEFGYQQQQLNIQEKVAKQAEGYALYGQQLAREQLSLTEAEQKEQFGYSKQQIDNGLQQIRLQMKSLNISEAQAATQYQNAVQQLGLGNVMNGIQLEQQIAALAGGGYSPIAGMLGQLQQLLPFLGGLFQSGGGGAGQQTGGGG